MKRLAILAAAAVLTGGCLVQQNRHTFYLDPDGAVTWTVVQEEIRSDATDPARRDDEEQTFLRAARLGQHAVARALDELGAERVDSRIVRDRRPFLVVTEARFDAVDELLETFLRRLGVPAWGKLRVDADGGRLELTFRPDDEVGTDEVDDPVWALLEPFEGYRFVLTEGRFTEAEGFRLEAQETAAVMLAPDDETTVNRDGEATYVLNWTAASGD